MTDVADVRAARAAAATAGEEVVAEERREDVAEVPEVEVARREAAAPQPGVAVAVVQLARLGLGEHLVGLGHLAEARLGVGLVGHVRMELARELAERLLDLGVGRSAGHAEELVVVAFGRGHRSAKRSPRHGSWQPPGAYSSS